MGAGLLSDCVRCATGKYQSGLGVTVSESCVDCDPGTFQPVEGASSRLACTSCPRGTYQSGHGASHLLNCSQCNPGTYQPSLGAVSAEQCIFCKSGTVSTGWGGGGADSCVPCQAGSYSSGLGITDPGECVQCEAGYVQVGIARSSPSDCRPCIPGTYQPIKGADGVGSCLACPEGTYQSGQGMTALQECVACSPGSYQSRRGMVSEGSCLACSSGTYQTGTGITSSQQCLRCGRGSYQSAAGSTDCTLCMAGAYQTGLGMINISQCVLCPQGTFQTGEGQEDNSTCQRCGVGTYQSLQGQISAATCIPCKAGTYQPLPGASGTSWCIPCWEGSYSTSTGVANASECVSCGIGLFSSSQGATSSSSCRQCLSGTYGSTSGIAQCVLCEAGMYQVDEGQTHCIACPLGTYQPLSGVKFNSWCLPCQSGKYQSLLGASASADCRLCTRGKYTSTWGQGVCLECTPGMYQALEGNVVCFNCMSGSFSHTPGAFECQSCRVGTYLNTTGGSMCVRCDPGTYQHLRGASHCFGCRRGEHQPNASSVRCLPCARGTFQSSDNMSACQSCESGLFASQSGAVSCTPCLTGQYQPSPRSTACVVCPSGTVQPSRGQGNCVACPSGSFQSMQGRTNCVLCAAGRYQTGVGHLGCTQCKPGTYNSKTGQTSEDDCLSCAPGFFSASMGAVWCSSCPSGLISSAQGQSTCSSCQPGFFQPTPGKNSCIACGRGKFSTERGMTRSANCIDCSPGFYSNHTGASFCIPCAPGSFQSARGSTHCSLCRAGSYMSSSGWERTACVLCNAGTFSSGVGLNNESACTFCPDGFYSRERGQTSSQTCELCQAGSMSIPLKTHCTVCGDGTICPPGYHQAIQCVPNLVCNGTFLEALPGFLPFVRNNCTAAIPCPHGTQCAGYNNTPPVDKGLVSADYTRTHFVVYENGPETTPLSCPGLHLSYGFRRLDPPETVQPPLTLFRLLPLRCPAGYYLLGGACVSCSPGTFSTMVGALDNTACIPCVPGFYSLGRGAVACSPARSGEFISLEGADHPQDCPSGSYQTGMQSTSCILCPPGSYAATTGMSSCVECPAGTAQISSGSTACDPCASTHFSSPGDARCSLCGVAPTSLDPAHGCSTPRLPSNLSSIWMTVQGDSNDECVSTGATTLLVGDTDTLSTPVQPLHWDAKCVHTLRFMGRPELTRTWTVPHVQLMRPNRLRVVPYNETFYPDICAEKGFGVVFTAQDVLGSMRTDLSGAGAVIRIFESTGKSLLFWMPCDRLPDDINEHIPLGVCHVNFCPTMAVLVKVVLSWDGGSVEGSASASPGPTPYCPPSTDWVAEVAVVSPGIPYFPGQKIRVRVQSSNSPSKVAVFKFALKILPGVSFVSFQSVYSIIHQLGDGMLSVMGNSEYTPGVSDPVLGELTLQLDAYFSGVMLILQVVPDSFQFTLTNAVSYDMSVYSHGFSCRTDGYVDLLTDFRRFTTLIAAPRRAILTNWRLLQESASVYSTRIDVIGVNNVDKVHWPVISGIILSAQCTSLSPQHITVGSCNAIQPANTSSGTREATVLVQFQGVQTMVNFTICSAVRPAVTTIRSPTGLTGRFKVFSQLQVGHGAIIPGGEVDATPFLGIIPRSGAVSIRNEQWSCIGSGITNFTVGRPFLFAGTCMRPVVPVVPASVFVYTGGNTGALGLFTFSSSLISVESPKGAILFFGTGPWSGQLVPLGTGNVMTLGESSARSLSLNSRNQTLDLLHTGVSARCSLIIFGSSASSSALFSGRIPVFPPATMSLRVSLSSHTLVTQQDLSGLIPSVTFVTEALLVFTDGSTRSVLTDPRLQLVSQDGMMFFTGLGAMSRTTAGNAMITARLAGMDCISTTVVVNILPSSVQSATLICPTCPQRLTLKDDPLSQQFPGEYPSIIPVTAFLVRRILVDGTVLDRHENITVGPGGGIVSGEIFGLHAGALAVHTAFTSTPFVVHVFDRLAVSWSLLCNRQPCLNNLKLAPAGNGAGAPPFGYPTTLILTLELTLVDETIHTMGWAGGVECLANRTRRGATSAGCVVPLVYGTLLVNAVFPSAWKMPRRGIPEQGHSIFVHQLHRLVLAGSRILYQLHCSLIWEEDEFTTTAFLTDGVSAGVQGVLRTTPPLVIRNGRVGSDWEGVGTLTSTFAGVGTAVQVQATRSSRFLSQVSIDFLPLHWATSHDRPLDIRPQLSPTFPLGPQTDLGRQNLTRRVLRWSSSVPQVVRFADDMSTMSLLSDYYQPLVITAQLLPCASFSGVTVGRELTVNVVPSIPGEIDFGAEETGLPMPPCAVGDIISVPFFIYAPNVLHSFIIEVYISEAAFEALDCTCGVLPNSQCGVVSKDGQTFCRSVGAFAASQLTGRLMLAEVKGKVLLNALATAKVVLLHAVLAESVVEAREYRFVLKLGSPLPFAPVITNRRSLMSSSMEIQSQAYGDTDGDGRFTSADVLFLEYYMVASVFKTPQMICLPIAGTECQSVQSLTQWQIKQLKPVRNPNRPASRPDGSDVLFLLRVLAGKAFFLASLEVVARPGFISIKFPLCDYTQDCSPPNAAAQVQLGAPGNRFMAFTSQSSYDTSTQTITVECSRTDEGEFTVTSLPTTVTFDEPLVGLRVITQSLDQFGSQDVSIVNSERFTFTPAGPVDFFNIIASQDSLLEEVPVVDYLPTTICQVLCDDPGLFLDFSLETPVWINETSFSVAYSRQIAPRLQGFWRAFRTPSSDAPAPSVQSFATTEQPGPAGFVWVGGRFNVTITPPSGIIMAVYRIQSTSPLARVFSGAAMHEDMLFMNTRIQPTATLWFDAVGAGVQETSVRMIDSFPAQPVDLRIVTHQVLSPFVSRLEVRHQCPLVILWTRVGGVQDDPCVVLITPIWSPGTQQSATLNFTCTRYPCVLQALGQTVRPVIQTAIPFQPGIVIQKPIISLGQRTQWRVVSILSRNGDKKETITQRALDAGMIRVQPPNALLVNAGSITGVQRGSAIISFAGVAVRINVTDSVNPPQSLKGFAFSSIAFRLRQGTSTGEGQITANFVRGPLLAGQKAFLFLQAFYNGGYALLLDPKPRADNITVVNATGDVVVSQVDGSFTVRPDAKGGIDRPLVVVRYRGVLLTVAATIIELQPIAVRACCNLTVAGQESPLYGLANYPSEILVTDLAVLFMGQSNYTAVDLMDPRIHLGFNSSYLEFASSTKSWIVKPGAPPGGETIIVVSYTQSVSLVALQTQIHVRFINGLRLEVMPDRIFLRRIHCSSSVFESFSSFRVSIVLGDGTKLLLTDQEMSFISSAHDIAPVHPVLGVVTGLKVGEAIITVQCRGFEGISRVQVVDQSVLLDTLIIRSPGSLVESTVGATVPILVGGVLKGGVELQDVHFLPLVFSVSDGSALLSGTTLIVQSNTPPYNPSTIHVELPPCTSNGTQLTALQTFSVRILPTITRTQQADVLLRSTQRGGIDYLSVQLVTSGMVLGVYVQIQTDILLTPIVCVPGKQSPVFADCTPDAPRKGSVIIAGAWASSFVAGTGEETELFLITPVPSTAWGFVEVFTGMSVIRVPVTAGRFGSTLPANPVAEMVPALPLVDTSVLFRSYNEVFRWPQISLALRNALYNLLLLVYKQRNVDPRMYSNDFELSAMFRVTDRFLMVDTSQTQLMVSFHTDQLPMIPGGQYIPSRKILRVPATHVQDGWYVVGWRQKIPVLTLNVSFDVSTTFTDIVWHWDVTSPFETGRVLPDCPRTATSTGTFLATYHLAGNVSQALLDYLACHIKVAARRIQVSGPTPDGKIALSVTLESLERVHLANQIIMSDLVASQLLPLEMFNSTTPTLQGTEGMADVTGVERAGIVYTNDTNDPPTPCPAGFYFSKNGTYLRLPVHAYPGFDCYDIVCADGYTIFEEIGVDPRCIPNPVTMEIVWICVSLILLFIACVSLVIFCVHCIRNKNPAAEEVVFDQGPAHSNDPPKVEPPPFSEEDAYSGQFRNIVTGMYLDDMSATMLDDEFSPVPFGENYGRNSNLFPC